MCKISIIVPVYNIEKYVEHCLQSIQKQTFQDYEVLIVDDGSTDQSGVICDRFSNKDIRFKVIHKENEGVSIARNIAIDKAQGKYLLFFDGDDYVDSSCLEELLKLIEAQKADAVIFGYNLVEKGKIIEVHPPIFDKKIYEGDAIKKEVMTKFIGVSYQDIHNWFHGVPNALQKENTGIWHSMIQTDLIKSNHIIFDKNLKVGEDTCFTTEYLSVAKKVCISPKCYYHLVVRETSTIFMYEKNPIDIAVGKTALLKGRRDLTNRILQRSGYQIEELWYGTVLMSIFQLALSLQQCKEPFLKRYQCYMGYVHAPETQRAISRFQIKGFCIKATPFLLLKAKLYRLIFLGSWIMKKISFQFHRAE